MSITDWRFPNPCPVCLSHDDHADWRQAATASPGWMFSATHCPHPGEPGHGTGCCCAGISAETIRAEAQRARTEHEASTFDTPSSYLLGTGPRHERTGTLVVAARVGGEDYRATLKAMTWTGCNGQRCARDCGPGHHVVLWVPCQFAVGHGHHYTVTDEEIARLRDVLRMLPGG